MVTKKEGIAWNTTPLDIATGISKTLAKDVIVAEVTYIDKVESVDEIAVPEAMSDSEDEEDEARPEDNLAVQWDLTRPLEGSCKLRLLKFDDPQGVEAFWHSAAHMLGGALEALYGGFLCIGPPLEAGYYYDIFVGNKKLGQEDFKEIDEKVMALAKSNVPFERLVLTKDEALSLFADNPFKLQLITNKVPDGSKTSAYRCGPVIDLCMGPHLPSTDRVKSAMCTKNSSAYWLGKATNDSLQRVYGISFPNDKLMKDYKKMLAEAAQRDHRNVGTQQELFFFHSTHSPGSCFWQPLGARIYNKLIDFIRNEYRLRGFHEVITPNIYSEDLFLQSGHYLNYLKNMYRFDVEGQDWFLKPMNCPGHCMIFDHRVRSYKELPIRMASFGVLHRNELSGTLSGLTRVRRFQQDDAHIFCRFDQVKEEIRSALEFLYFVYGVFGFEFNIKLSTRPKKAMGDRAMWDKAEAAMKEVLNESGHVWSLNPGDGAFYGPKIDIRLTDAMRRQHQCGTIQLDFQLPIRFNLQYNAQAVEEVEAEDAEGQAPKAKEKEKKETKSEEKEAKDQTEKGEVPAKLVGAAKAQAFESAFKPGKLKPGFERPVIIHRAILGSVERQIAILTEHFGGKWPFWLSPKQVIVIPVAKQFNDYAKYVATQVHNFGFYAEAELSGLKLNKKIRNAQLAQWNYMAIVGEKEEGTLTVNLRSREGGEKPVGTFTLTDFLKKLRAEDTPTSQPLFQFGTFEKTGATPESPYAVVRASNVPTQSEPDDKGVAQSAKEVAPSAKTSDESSKPSKKADTVEEFLEVHPYVAGFMPSKADRDMIDALTSVPKSRNLLRWYNHISTFSPTERALWA